MTAPFFLWEIIRKPANDPDALPRAGESGTIWEYVVLERRSQDPRPDDILFSTMNKRLAEDVVRDHNASRLLLAVAYDVARLVAAIKQAAPTDCVIKPWMQAALKNSIEAIAAAELKHIAPRKP